MKDKYSAGLVQTEIREEWRTMRESAKTECRMCGTEKET